MQRFIGGTRTALGLIFVVFGLNGFVQFIDVPDFHPFMAILVDSGYIYLVKAFEVVGGLMLLSNRYVPLGLCLLAPVVVNIAAYHLLLDPRNIEVGILVVVMEAILLWAYRSSLSSLFEARAEPR